ncbi:hypothetical protein GJAV_G00212080 [Gymnothorax javanicus]|nr:hypothetical protein GJAV_G00212080 [Gymnothorax javanicus]
MNETRGNIDGHVKRDAEQQEKWVGSETSVPGSGCALSMGGQKGAFVRRGAHSEELEQASFVAGRLPWNVETECRGVDHEVVLQHIREEHREQMLLSEFQLETCLPISGAHQERAEQDEAGESEEENLSQNGSFINNQSQQLEKYLFSAALRTHTWPEEHSLLGKAEDCGYWGDSEEFLVGLESFSDDAAGLDGSAEVETDLGKALLVQQCRDLASQLEERDEQLEERSKQLEERDKQLNELQDEYCSSAAQLQEALKQREEVRRALEVLQNQLEAEQEWRLWCEEVALREKREMEELKAELGRRERAGEQERGLMAELQQEKEQLFLQLRAQEQLVRDVQQQKLVGDSVSSEVQALFGRQLSILQEQRDRLQGMLDLQQAKNLTASELLGQKTMELDSSLEEVQKLQAKLAKMEERLRRTAEDKRELESGLLGLQEKLAAAEQAVSRGLVEKAAREGHVLELEAKAQTAENVLEVERGKFQSQVRVGALELQELREERDAARAELQEQVNDLKAEMERKQTELTACIALIKQVHERERQREMTALSAEREAELSRLGEELREGLETAHQTELLQTQTQHVLELEALRLNLANQHEAELEALRLSLANQHGAEQEALRLSLTTRHEEELEVLRLSLTNQHAEEVEALRLNLANRHEAELEALRLSLANQHIGEVEALQQSLTNQHAAEVEQRRLMDVVSEERESLRARLAQISTQHQAELQQVRDDQQNQNQQGDR